MDSRGEFAIAAVAAVAALTAGCGGGASGEAPPSASPSPLPSSTPEQVSLFEEISGLTIPSDAEGMEVDAVQRDDGRPNVNVHFQSTRGGAEVLCDASNFSPYLSDGPPDSDQRETFRVVEDDGEIAQTVVCRGGHPEDPNVDRGALVLFPEDGFVNGPDAPDGQDTVVVYALAMSGRTTDASHLRGTLFSRPCRSASGGGRSPERKRARSRLSTG